MADVLAAPPEKSYSKKRRKTIEPSDDRDAHESSTTSKRQKTTDARGASATPARTLLKISPVPFPTLSPSPPATPGGAQAAPAASAGAVKKQKHDGASVALDGAIKTPHSGLKRTAVLPPPISPMEHDASSVVKKKKKSKKDTTERMNATQDTTTSVQPVVNGAESATQDVAHREKKSKNKEREISKTEKKKGKIKQNDPWLSVRSVASPVAADRDSRRDASGLTELLQEPQNIANLDPTNDISGRELPQTTENIAEPQTPAPLEEKKKKKRKDGPEVYLDSVEALKDDSMQSPAIKSKKEKKRKHKSSEENGIATTAGSSTDAIQKHPDEAALALTRLKEHRDLVKQNINVSRDFGLQGGLEFPSGSDYNTGFHLFNALMYLSVPPLGSGYPLQAAVNLGVSQYLFNYYPPARGILICHTNHQICPPPNEVEDSLTKISDGYASSSLWVSVDLYIFRPTRGAWLHGNISLQHESHIAVMIMGHWPASVARKRLPRSWRWIPFVDEDDYAADSAGGNNDDAASLVLDDNASNASTSFLQLGGAGYWIDGASQPVMGQVVIRALDFDVISERAGATVVSIEGSMLSEEEDREADLVDELAANMQPQSRSAQALPSAPAASASSSSSALLAGSAIAEDTDATSVDGEATVRNLKRSDYKTPRLGAHRKTAVVSSGQATAHNS